MTKPIRVREYYHKRSYPAYIVFVRGAVYVSAVHIQDLNKWLGHAITHVRATSDVTEPLNRVQTCE